MKMRNVFSSHSNSTRESAISSESMSDVFPRRHLVSLMLKDRTVLRMICAPKGFGKTSLAREYAEVVFGERDVIWIDCLDPSFICCLDDETVACIDGFLEAVDGFSDASQDTVHLVVFDDLFGLDHQRATVLSKCIDELLAAGNEVIAIATPANDCLRALQPDRLFLSAQDLMVSEDEYTRNGMPGANELYEQGRFLQTMGIPLLVAHPVSSGTFDCVKGFFDENLPLEFVMPAAVMLLLESGRLSDLTTLDVNMGDEILETLSSSYPMLGIDQNVGRFDTIMSSPIDISRAGVKRLMRWGREDRLLERIVWKLVCAGNTARASDILLAFCPEAERVRWLERRGCDLIDRNQFGMLRSVMESTDGKQFMTEAPLKVLDAWVYFLSGDHYAAAISIAGTDHLHYEGAARFGYLILRQLLARGDAFRDIDDSLSAMDFEKLVHDATECGLTCQGLDYRLPGMLGSCPFDKGGGVHDGGAYKRCAQLNILLRVLLMAGPERYGDSSDASDEPLVSAADLLESALALRNTCGYRLALHAAIRFAWDEADVIDDEGETTFPTMQDSNEMQRLLMLLARVTMPILVRGVETYSEALLVLDFERSGHINIDDDDRALAETITRSTIVVRRYQETTRIAGVFSPMEAIIDVGSAEGEYMHTEPPDSPIVQTQPIQPSVPPLYVKLFGGFEIYLDGHAVSGDEWHHRTVRHLIALLVLNRGNDVPRDQIQSRIWPQLDYLHARDNFYTTWGHLRRACGNSQNEVPYFIRTDTCCRANLANLDSDIYEFERLVRDTLTGRLSTAEEIACYVRIEELYSGDLMSTDYLNSAFEALRLRYHEMFVQAMIRASTCASERSDASLALWFAQRASDYESQREDVYRCLMQAQILAGQRTAAIGTYEACRTYLANELGVNPTIATTNMLNDAIIPFYREQRKPSKRKGKE